MSSTTFRQELPPPKGYEKVIFERIPVKKPWPISIKVGLYVAFCIYGSWRFRISKQIMEDRAIEEKAGRACLIPILTAERDRALLRDFKKIREEEKELMKNVPGWIPGTLWGEPIYKSIGPNDFYFPIEDETYAHASLREKDKSKNTGRFC